jgi:hypothetical protein
MFLSIDGDQKGSKNLGSTAKSEVQKSEVAKVKWQK